MNLEPLRIFRKGLTNSLNMDQCRDVLLFMNRIRSCTALQSRAEINAASVIVGWLGLPSHHDPQKNWDTLKSLYYILELNDANEPILDSGSGSSSVILKWLSLLGYKRLYACDIRAHCGYKYEKAGINFSLQEVTRTNYPNGIFQIVVSISVIEHGVLIDRYMQEMSRILRPGGLLLTSTDYWSEPVDCSGIYPYGKEMDEMKVFQPTELKDLCEVAEKRGLTLCSPLNLATKERAVRWERVDREYTFVFMAFKRIR